MSQIAPPVSRSSDGLRDALHPYEIDDQPDPRRRVRQAHDSDERQARDPQHACSALEPSGLGHEHGDEETGRERGDHPEGMVRDPRRQRQHEHDRGDDRDGHLDPGFFARDAPPRHPDRHLGDAHRAARIDESLQPFHELGQIVAELVRLRGRGLTRLVAALAIHARDSAPPANAALGRDRADWLRTFRITGGI